MEAILVDALEVVVFAETINFVIIQRRVHLSLRILLLEIYFTHDALLSHNTPTKRWDHVISS